MQVTRSYAEYRGRTVEVSHVGDQWVAVVLDGGDFPDATDRGETAGVAWARLPSAVVPRRWRERVHGRWQGEDVEVLPHRDDDRVVVSWVGPPERGRELGLRGDQHQGWTAVVPASEVEVTDVETKELI